MRRYFFWVGQLVALGLMTISVTASGASLVGNGRLTASDGQLLNYFGAAVDIAPDGSYALVGSPPYWSTDSGSAYIFPFLSTSAGIKLIPADSIPGGQFGSTVALSDDKTTAIVGAPDATVGDTRYQGAVYVFTRSDGWSQRQKLVAPDGATEAMFGCSVDISDDGNTVIVGSCSNFGMSKMVSKVYIFVRQGTFWSLQDSFRGHDTEADDAFAHAVALSGDGNTALVGAFMDHVGSNLDQGSAYIFVRGGIRWLEQKQLTASDGTMWTSFGKAVDLSDDGNTALVGDDTTDDQGAAYVFVRTGGSWSQQQKLQPSAPDPYFNRFARSVALSNNGNLAAIGDVESAYLFVCNGTIWNEQERMITNDTESHGFGSAVALSDDGKRVLVGAPESTGRGVTYIFRPMIPMVGPRYLLREKIP